MCPAGLATTKRLLDEAAGRPRDLRGAAAISAAIRRLGRGTGRHPRLCRKAPARLGLVPDRRRKLHDAATPPLARPWVWDQTVGSALDRTAARFPDHDALVFPASRAAAGRGAS